MRGYFSIGIMGCKNIINVGTLWRSAGVFGASYIFTVGKRYKQQASDTHKTTRHVPLFEFETFAEFKKHLPKECRLIGVELTNEAEPLENTTHPQQCCYLLGAEDSGLSQDVLKQCHAVVRLPGKRSMNVSVVGSILMWDRYKAGVR